MIDLRAVPRRLEGQRVWLETPCAGHAEAFAAGVLESMPALLYVAWSQAQVDQNWARSFCESDARCTAAGEDLAFHVFAHEDGGWVGRIDVHTIDLDAGRGEMGYVGHSRRAGRGLMREAALRVIDTCFLHGFQRIEAMSDARNQRALHFAQTLGMQREGVLRRHERDPQGALCDMVLFAILNPKT